MLITHIQLTNFKSYAGVSLDFAPGTTAIIGENGAGKSSLLEAIGFVLFNYSAGNMGAFVAEGAREATIIVRMESSLDVFEYEIERRFTRQSTTRYRVYSLPEKAVVAEGAADVLDWLRRHLRLAMGTSLPDVFAHAVGVPQGTFTSPFLQTPSGRAAIFDPLLQVDVYRLVSDKLRAPQREIEGTLAQLETRLATLRGQLGELASSEEQAAALAFAIDEHVAEIARKDTEHAKLGVARLEMERLWKAIEASRVLLVTKRAERAVLDEKIRSQEALVEASTVAAVVVRETSAGHRAYVEAQERLAELEPRRVKRDELNQEAYALGTNACLVAATCERHKTELHEIVEREREATRLGPQVEQQTLLENKIALAVVDKARLPDSRRRAQVAWEERDRAQAHLKAQREELARTPEFATKVRDNQELVERLGNYAEVAYKNNALAQTELARLCKERDILEQAADKAMCPLCGQSLTTLKREHLVAINAQAQKKWAATVEEAYAKSVRAKQRHIKAGLVLPAYEQELLDLATEEDVERARRDVIDANQKAAEERATLAKLEKAEAAWTAATDELAVLGDPWTRLQVCKIRVEFKDEIVSSLSQAQEKHEEMEERLSLLRQILHNEYGSLDRDMAVARNTTEECRAAYERCVEAQADANALSGYVATLAQMAGPQADIVVALDALESDRARLLEQYDASEHGTLERQVRIIGGQIAVLRGEHSKMGEQLQLLQERVSRMRVAEQECEEKEKESAGLDTMRTILHQVRAMFREAGPLVTRRLVNRISREASAIFAEMMDEPGSQLTWTEDYALSLNVGEVERGFAQLSGGEQMTAALALRLALMRVVSGIDVAFFDEPTAHLDPQRRESLARKIMQVRGFKQVFVISHDNTFEAAAQSYVRVTKDGEGSHCMSSAGGDA